MDSLRIGERLRAGLLLPGGSYKRLQRWIVVFALGITLVGWSSVGAMLYAGWQQAIDAQTGQNTNLARVLAEQTLRVIAVLDHTLIRLSTQPVHHDSNLVREANETGLAPGILVQLSVIDAQGRFVRSNLDPTGTSGPIDLSDRPHVQAHLLHRGPDTRDELFIGEAVLGKVSRRWTIQLSRRIVGPEGHTAGVVVASVDPGYFEKVFRSMDLRREGGAALLGEDGNIRARVVGGRSEGMGRNLISRDSLAQFVGRPESTYQRVSTVDHVARLFSLRRVGDYPLHVSVFTSVDEALATWRLTRNTVILMAALMTTVIGAAALALGSALALLGNAHEALQQSELQAHSANHAKGEFLAAMSHELRTPLTSIRGYAELLEHQLAGPDHQDHARVIRHCAEHLNELMSDILDLSKADVGAMTLNPTLLDLPSLLQASVDYFAPAAARKGLFLVLTLQEGLPRTVCADGLRLRQIITNLLSNAVKFTEFGGIQVSAHHRGEAIEISVIDSGPGVPAEEQEAVFEKFRQGRAGITRQQGGTGLGLALSRSLALLMNGSLTLASVPGAGALFTLRFPLGRPTNTTAPHAVLK